MPCECLRDDLTRQILSIYNNVSEKTQRKILCVMCSVASGTDEEAQILDDYLNGKEDRMQEIFNKYMPQLEALEKEGDSFR